VNSSALKPRLTPALQTEYWFPDDEAPIHATLGVLSRFGDDVWDLSALRGVTPWNKKLDFLKAFSEHCAYIKQYKLLVYFLLQEHGAELPSASTFMAKTSAMRVFGRHCIANRVSLFEGLESQAVCASYVNDRPSSAIELFSFLLKLRRFSKQFEVKVPFAVVHPLIMDAQAKVRRDEKQTPPIPSRIYSQLLSALLKELECVEAVMPELLAYLHKSKEAVRGEYPEPTEGLNVYRAHLGQGAQAPRLSEIAGWIANAYCVVRATVAAYSGMRRAEAQNLPLRALEEFQRGGSTHYCIRGFTSKLHNGKQKETVWITNGLGVRAVRVAQQLANALYELGGVGVDGPVEPLLFPRHGWGSYGDLNPQRPQDATLPWEKLVARISPVIQASDIAELSEIDADRSWEEEPEFAPGMQWPFTMHQLRRSLALYAHRSGLVTLPSLKAQLQHLTKEMAEYYARGSEFAASMVFDQDHFASEWNAGRALSEYLGYVKTVLMSDERLFGGAASWARSPAVVASPVSVHSREHAVRMFERGEIAFKETVLGGCTNTERCSTAPLAVIPYQCLEGNCKNLVVRQSKLEEVIENQEIVVAKLGAVAADSVEHRLEAQGLEVLKTTLQKMNEKELA